MHEEIFRVLETGATLITINRRLARSFARDFHAWQMRQGRTVWRPPDILPLEAFLLRAWNDWVWHGMGDNIAALLNPLQEQVTWEQIIRASPAGETLLSIPETARLASETWQLVHAYRVRVDARFEASDDWAAFAGWSREFENRCRAERWLEAARLSDFIARRLTNGQIQRPSRMYIAGFDDPTPQQADLFTALGAPIPIEPVRCEPAVAHFKFEDAASEIRAAAVWSRRLIEQEPETQIGIIVPELAKSRARTERIFREVLDPSATLADEERCFHVSLGPALADAPVVHAALLMLEFGLRDLPLPALGALLRSPFLGGSEAEWTHRGLLDARLRRHGLWNLSVATLRRESSDCPLLQRTLGRFEKALQTLPAEQRPTHWSRDFSKLLDALGWPGDRTLDSREYQAVQAWRERLSDLAALDVASPLLNFDQALSRLREIAAFKAFQIENEGAPIQIMGALEAAHLSFDHLWIMGLHDEALPSAAAPNPFLPLSLQREHKLPHSSAERELEFARNLISRLMASAPDVVLSYPVSDGDRALTPSPLISGPWRKPLQEATPVGEWIARMRQEVSFEQIADELAPQVVSGSGQRGGASLFKDMAACPFRAFAKHRLAARPLEETVPGLSYKDRGITIHRALQIIWSELGSHQRLTEQAPDQLQALISRAARGAVDGIPHAVGRQLEQRRLEKLLYDWLQIEKSRGPFTVHGLETERDVSIGGLGVRIRADRIDELPAGGDLIVDYKTGQFKSTAWDSDRPTEPQLPLYCATSDRPIVGAAFAQIRVGDLAFQGLAENAAALPAMKKMRMEPPVSLQQQIHRWRQVLENLARNFRDGHAEVDPKEDACANCGLWGLCRIRELQNDGR
ncbi:MAG TPA: PD-(D/E)XK nuclease family protein [Bryobacteraceae bacterium]|nr:PD-(D/E)XK nuclease family protein [Bryobacteraceae bacterium]